MRGKEMRFRQNKTFLTHQALTNRWSLFLFSHKVSVRPSQKNKKRNTMDTTRENNDYRETRENNA